MVSVNQLAAPAPFREPPPRSQVDPSNRRRFRPDVFIASSGYRTRYLLVAAATGGRLG
jgi:hypothetical protein